MSDPTIAELISEHDAVLRELRPTLVHYSELGGRAVELTSREFSLLEHLMRSAGTVFTRAQILEQVWGYDFDPATNVVDVCIKRVRAKLQDAAVDAFKSHRWIESGRGLGYRFVAPPQEEAL